MSLNKVMLNKLRKHSGLSMVEVMAGIVIFTLLFMCISRAFAPSATSSHNLIRGTTVAMNACNWYLNTIEQRIQFEGVLPSSELGEQDITDSFKTEQFSEIQTLRKLKVTSDIKLSNNLYNAKVVFNWGNSDGDTSRQHHFELSRLIVQPNY